MYESMLRHYIGKDVEVENGPQHGWAGPIIEVGREAGRLYVDVDWGYRFYVDETANLSVYPSKNPQPVGDWCRETHPHLFEDR